ncbi:hypothetical protein GOODEAATRI_010193 [Goodea atripinnis]|uniref:PH domain-containing protein n=1 Tax=Goodea atripinnis TaxID=208336 RepID=A0ABV0MIK2_9TELE
MKNQIFVIVLCKCLTPVRFALSGIKDGLKRRRLEAAGRENQSPELASSRLLAEFQPKPDTPIIPSVRSRVQLLTQRNDGNFLMPLKLACSYCDDPHLNESLRMLTPPKRRVLPAPAHGPAPVLCLAFSRNYSAQQHPAPSRLPSYARASFSTGNRAPSDATGASTELRLTSEGQKESISHGEEDGTEKELKTVILNKEEQPGSHHPEVQTVLKLSFSEEHSLSELHAADKNSFLQSTLLDESNAKETSHVSIVTEEERSEVFTFDDDETMEGSTYGEEEIETSTDEELRVWRYPQRKVSVDEEAISEKKEVFTKENEEDLEVTREGKEKGSSFTNNVAPDLDVSNKTAGFFKQQKDENIRPEGDNGVDDSLKRKSALQDEALREKSSCNAVYERNAENVAQPHEGERGSAEGRKDVVKAESSKKVTFILEPELINSSALSESDVSAESKAETSLSDAGSECHDDTNTAETIEKMFEEVLEYAEKVEEEGRVEEDGEDHDSGIGACSGGKNSVDLEREKNETEEAPREEECDEDELLTFPQSGILSPLSKSVEAVVTPLALNEEAGKLQTVINQTLQALSCCTDEEHGRGSLEEAEAEKLLLVSCEKRSALLAEVARLREERNLQTEEAAKEDTDYVSQQACRGTVSITNIQLPLKVEFVCLSHSRAGAAPAALNTRRSSNFSLVGSHKITLASLGCSKFPLDKVPFLSPLEGHIYLKLDSEGHSDVQHQGFLVSSVVVVVFLIFLQLRSPSQCVRPVKRDSCARPFTFELANASQQEDQNQEAPSKCWFSADTKQERLDWMEKLNQALLDFHTWNCPQAENQASSSGNLRESIL